MALNPIFRQLIFIVIFSLQAFGKGKDGPVANFSFNNGTKRDNISNIDPKLVGVNFAEDRFGNANSAVYIHGNEFSYVNLGTDPVLKPQVGSISLWLKIEMVVYAGKGFYVNPILITKNSNNDDFFEAYAIYYSYETYRIQTAASYDSLKQVGIYGVNPFHRFIWHHVALTYDYDSIAFYVDGQLQGRHAKKFETRFQQTDSVILGTSANQFNNRSFNGLVDDIQFYDRVLSDKEVVDLFNAPNPNRTRVLIKWLLVGVAFALVVFLIYFSVRYRVRQSLKKDQERLELNNIMLETELRVNRALMNPHFVFNSLNALQKFILEQEYVLANSYLVKFSKLMRKILETNMSNTISLETEIELLERYLEIEDLRFEENIQHSITVDPQIVASTIRIPVMMLQPFIENAIWHGLLKKKGEKLLLITFSKPNDKYLLCTIDDNGLGRKKHSLEIHEKQSLAIRFIEQRLELLNQLHDLKCSLTIIDKPDSGGTTIKILLPILKTK